MRFVRITNLVIRDILKGSVAASLKLTGFLAIGMNIHEEVIMSISIATTVSLHIVALYLVTGVRFLGSSGEFLTRGEVIVPESLSRPRGDLTREVRFLPSPLSHSGQLPGI